MPSVCTQDHSHCLTAVCIQMPCKYTGQARCQIAASWQREVHRTSPRGKCPCPAACLPAPPCRLHACVREVQLMGRISDSAEVCEKIGTFQGLWRAPCPGSPPLRLQRMCSWCVGCGARGCPALSSAPLPPGKGEKLNKCVSTCHLSHSTGRSNVFASCRHLGSPPATYE